MALYQSLAPLTLALGACDMSSFHPLLLFRVDVCDDASLYFALALVGSSPYCGMRIGAVSSVVSCPAPSSWYTYIVQKNL